MVDENNTDVSDNNSENESSDGELDIYNMSDSELEKLTISNLPENGSVGDIVNDGTDLTEDDGDDDASEESDQSDETDETENDSEERTEESEDETESDNEDESTERTKEDQHNDESNDDDTSESESEEDAESSESDDSEVNNKVKGFDRIMAPFLADGTQMQVKTPDEAVSLMQRGVNYTNKMKALAPHRKTLRILEKNNIGTEQLNYLIDLHQRKPEAINKLVQDSKIDPMDIKPEDGNNYQATEHTNEPGLDQEVALEDVISSIKGTESGDKTLAVIGNDWDEVSMREIANSPQDIKILNTQMGNGVFDEISKEITRQRALGTLDGVNDIQAYQQVGIALQNTGGFDHLFPENKDTKSASSKTVRPKPDNADKLNTKRKAARSSRSNSKSNTVKKDFNPLNMSDEEFEKQMAGAFN